jgi:uncharacterized membrane protein YdbT with pleckstrin-like domain
MLCQKCGKENPDNNKFCKECGAPLTNSSFYHTSIRIPKDMSLTEGEIPIWFGQMSWASMWLVLLVGIVFLFTIIFFFISIICFLVAWIDVSTSEYFISNKRIYFKRGLISRVMNDIKIEWVTNIFVQQGIFGRLLNFGNIGISSPGERAGAIGFVGVSDPMTVKAIIEDTLAKYKKNP